MREFRGKTTKKENENHEFNNVFVYGDLLTNKGVYYIHPQNNVFRVHNELANILIAHEVIPETVGQYTGLTDKNGKKIFENGYIIIDNKTYKVTFNNAEYILTNIFNCDIITLKNNSIRGVFVDEI